MGEGIFRPGKTAFHRIVIHLVVSSAVFNVGEYRRDAVKVFADKDFFDPDNARAVAVRKSVLFLSRSKRFDRGFSLVSAHRMHSKTCATIWPMMAKSRYSMPPIQPVIVDSLSMITARKHFAFACSSWNRSVIRLRSSKRTFEYVPPTGASERLTSVLVSPSRRQEVKLKSPDYKDIPQEAAVTDFLSRIHQYEKRYETIDDKSERNYSFIKIFNCGERFLVHKIGGKAWPVRSTMHRCSLSGHIQSRVVYFLMNIHILPRTIYLTRVSDEISKG